MNRIIVIAFSMVDGIIEDPDGTSGTPNEQDLVDEYRILVFAELVGRGTRLFTAETTLTRLRQISSETIGRPFLCATSVSSSDGDYAGVKHGLRTRGSHQIVQRLAFMSERERAADHAV